MESQSPLRKPEPIPIPPQTQGSSGFSPLGGLCSTPFNPAPHESPWERPWQGRRWTMRDSELEKAVSALEELVGRRDTGSGRNHDPPGGASAQNGLRSPRREEVPLTGCRGWVRERGHICLDLEGGRKPQEKATPTEAQRPGPRHPQGVVRGSGDTHTQRAEQRRGHKPGRSPLSDSRPLGQP